MKQWSVKSETQKNVFYLVRETKDGLRCSCPHFIMREKKIGECKHIKKLNIHGRD